MKPEIMAEVLTTMSADQEFGGPLRRTSSHPTLLLDTQTQGQGTIDKTDCKATFRLRESSRSSVSAPSSGPSSPHFPQIDFSNRTSCLSTPSSSLSLDDSCDDDGDDAGDEYDDETDEEQIAFPSYGAPLTRKPSQSEGKNSSMESTPRGSPCGERVSVVESSLSGQDRQSKKSLHRSDSMTTASIADDTAAKPQPTRHVDYLSHDWKEEDIWSSWRHIVGKRGCLDNWERLENASWRTWMKAQRKLSTINPDKLNWMKDHDVTWLYGPLQTGSNHIQDMTLRSALSRNDSFVGKKPILKKRSISEVMLQRSISSQSLMRQAVDSIRAQEAAYASARPNAAARGFSDFAPRSSLSTSSNPTMPDTPSPMPSYASSDSGTPDEGRHIHFNETVEQCIAISSDGDEPDDDYGYDETVIDEDEEHSSDEEFLTMKTDRSFERKLSRSSTPRNSFSDGSGCGKTIAMLPATKLKYRPDTPDLAFQNHAREVPGLRGSSSQETLRPSRPHANFLIDDDDDDYDLDPEWTSSNKTAVATSNAKQNGSSSPQRIRFVGSPAFQTHNDAGMDVYRDANDELQHRNMRRTPSGMFMPYEEGDEQVTGEGEGLLGKVVDTYNTARDIAHVIWNVGWRR